MTLEDLLSEITDRGWYVYQLCASPTGAWRAYLRDPLPPSITYGEGDSPFNALDAALAAAPTVDLSTPTYSIAPKFDLDAILGLSSNHAIGAAIASKLKGNQ